MIVKLNSVPAIEEEIVFSVWNKYQSAAALTLPRATTGTVKFH